MSTGDTFGSVPAAAYGVVDGMGLVDRVWPGIEEQTDKIVEVACELADATAGHGWSAAAADALVAIDTLTVALARVDPDVREALIAVTAATAPGVPGPRGGRRSRRRGLGPGFQGIR
ncbi:hypothetical protein [Streptomyces cinereoruber]|uniref:hypothetical protein n=1 Tax=Streptomyces cinereoruber TaxID=67260 RepID=UPI00363B0568